MKKLLCLLLALGALLCLCACSEEKAAPPEELVGYECDGLLVKLGKGFMKQDMAFSAGYFTSVEGDTVQIWTEHLRGYGGAVTSSQTYAETHANNTRDQFQSMEVKTENGVSYSVASTGQGYQVCGYYVDGDGGWIIQITCAEVTDSIIRYATSAEVMN